MWVKNKQNHMRLKGNKKSEALKIKHFPFINIQGGCLVTLQAWFVGCFLGQDKHIFQYGNGSKMNISVRLYVCIFKIKIKLKNQFYFISYYKHLKHKGK